MANRPNQLAGLAALGALGYIMSRDKKGEAAPVETRSFSPNPASSAARETPVVAARDEGDNYPDESRRGRMTSPPESISAPARASASNRASPVAKEDYVSQDKSLNGPPVTDVYPDESRRGRMATIGRPVNPSAIAQGVARMPGTPESVSVIKRTRGAQAGEEEAYREAQAAARSAAPASSAASAPASAASRAASAPASAASRPASAAARPASAASNAAPEQRSGLTLGVPTRPAPGAPSIYAGPEAWAEYRKRQAEGKKKGGAVKKMASGGMSVSKASSRADGIAQRGKTRGKMY